MPQVRPDALCNWSRAWPLVGPKAPQGGSIPCRPRWTGTVRPR